MSKSLWDLIIIGAGPAGLTAAIYAGRAQLSVLILEGQMPGGKVALTSEVENWPGHQYITGTDLAMEFYQHALAFGADYQTGQVDHIVDQGKTKLVYCGDVVHEAKTVLIASGTVERHLNIPGEKEFYGAGVSYCAVCDGAFFRNREVVVIGGGNVAFEDALYLTRFASKVTLVTRRAQARADRTNQQRVLENEKIEWLKGYVPVAIEGEEGYVTGLRLKAVESEEELLLPCSAVFPMVGMDANTAFLDFPGLKDEAGFILTKPDQSTSVEGLFAAGDVCQKELRQITTAASDGTIAAQAIAHYLDTWKERYEN